MNTLTSHPPCRRQHIPTGSSIRLHTPWPSTTLRATEVPFWRCLCWTYRLRLRLASSSPPPRRTPSPACLMMTRSYVWDPASSAWPHSPPQPPRAAAPVCYRGGGQNGVRNVSETGEDGVRTQSEESLDREGSLNGQNGKKG